MASVGEIVERVSRLLDGGESLEEFEDWLIGYSWNIHQRGDEATQKLAYTIDGIMWAFDGDDVSLLEALREAISSFIATDLSGEKLGRLSREEAKSLYGPLAQLHAGLTDEGQRERIGDILEALAWGSDDDLRGFIESSTAKFRH